MELGESELKHFAPNCVTFSRAREIPIKGVANPPKPLRSELFPEGIPSELENHNPRSQKRLADDTAMANLSADEAWKPGTITYSIPSTC